MREVQYAGAGADGWVSDLFELWVFEVRVSGAGAYIASAEITTCLSALPSRDQRRL